MAAIVKPNQSPVTTAINPFTPKTLDSAWELAGSMAASAFMPEGLRKGGAEVAHANAFMVLMTAADAGLNPVTLLQHVHVVSGKVGYSAQFLIARANSSGRFKNGIEYKVDGDPAKPDTLAVTAYAHRPDGTPFHGITVTMAQARKAGWTKNQKYEEMPQQMLMYRAAAFFVRAHAPEVAIGGVSLTAEELRDESAASADVVMVQPAPATTVEDKILSANAVMTEETPDQRRARVEFAVKSAKTRQDATAVPFRDAMTRDEFAALVNTYHPKPVEVAPPAEPAKAHEAPSSALAPEVFADCVQKMKDGEWSETDVYEFLEATGKFDGPSAIGREMHKVKTAAGVA
jgi:hypothetical protein